MCQLAISLTSWYNHWTYNQLFFLCMLGLLQANVTGCALVHLIELKNRCYLCQCCCSCSGRRTKCCGYSRTPAEPKFYSLVSSFTPACFFTGFQLTDNLVETFSRLVVLKDCNFSLLIEIKNILSEKLCSISRWRL